MMNMITSTLMSSENNIFLNASPGSDLHEIFSK